MVAASSRQGGVVTNGMSHRARDGENINGGLLVGVGPEDFPGEDVLAGVRFQEQWEAAAFRLGGGNFRAPAQRVEDFLRGRPSEGPGAVAPTYRPGVAWTDLSPCLPGYVGEALAQSLPLLDRKLHGFASPDGVLTGVETRSSSPVRILRDAGFQSALRGSTPAARGRATPEASSPPPWTASGWPRRWPRSRFGPLPLGMSCPPCRFSFYVFVALNREKYSCNSEGI